MKSETNHWSLASYKPTFPCVSNIYTHKSSHHQQTMTLCQKPQVLVDSEEQNKTYLIYLKPDSLHRKVELQMCGTWVNTLPIKWYQACRDTHYPSLVWRVPFQHLRDDNLHQVVLYQLFTNHNDGQLYTQFNETATRFTLKHNKGTVKVLVWYRSQELFAQMLMDIWPTAKAKTAQASLKHMPKAS